MPFASIFKYSLFALLFGATACGLWLLARLALSRRPWTRRDRLRLIAVGYLAAVLQIIGLRLGLRAPHPLGGMLQLMPLRTTVSEWRGGAGAFIYHLAGNLMWFVPLGLLLPRLRPGCRWHHVLLAGALLSVCVEGLQYLLGTGVSDVDDVLLNASGALLGYGLYRFRRR